MVFPFHRKLVFGFVASVYSVVLGSSLFCAVNPSRLRL